MRVSIITATYNSESTVRATIESVLSQSYDNVEYLIIDGASSDKTLDVVREYESRFAGRMRIVSEPDEGIYDALNKGVRYATGDIIGFLHADDMYATDEVVERVVEAFVGDSCDALYGDLHYVDSSAQRVVRNWKSREYEPRLLPKGWMPPHPTLYLRREIYQKIGEFDQSFRISADYDFILRVFMAINPNRVVYLPFVMVRMRVGGVSNRGLRNIVQKSKEDMRALRKSGVRCPIMVVVRKNLSKVGQFFVK